jgi:hypothetical protein
MRGKPALKQSKEGERPGPQGSKYTVLSVSQGDCEFTWCFGPGISTIFITEDEFPHDFRVLVRWYSS